MKKPIIVRATGLGHPEGPYELDDGRVIFANSYASEIGCWDPKTNAKTTYAFVGGGPNACMLGSDGAVYSTRLPMSEPGSRPSTGRLPFRRRPPTARWRSWSTKPTENHSTGRTT